MIHGISSNRTHLNENPSMRAVAKILGARAGELSSDFCEHFWIKCDYSIPYHCFSQT